MPRTEKSAGHTAASLKHAASQLEEMAVSLRAAALLLELDPAIPAVEVNYEPSREKGIAALTAWVNEARRAANVARMNASLVPLNGRVSDKPDTGPKRGRKNKNSA